MLTRRQFLIGTGLALLAGDTVLARPLLRSRSFPAPVPPGDDSWVRSGSNPILSPSGWEGGWIIEPTVLFDGGLFKMIYTGNNDNTGLQQFGLATSSDGIAWTRYGGNPVFGHGVGGEASGVVQPNIVKFGSTFYLYYTKTTSFKMNVATSTDLVNWTIVGSDILTVPAGVNGWNNRTVILEGGTYYMLVEGYVNADSKYRIFLATSADLLAWTIGNSGNPLSSLAVPPDDGYGGSFLWPHKIAGLWHVWYHSTPVVPGTFASDIYHATSPDLVNWTQSVPNPVLQHTGTGFEVDQVGDPSIVVRGSVAFLFYDGVDNTTLTGAIGVATAPAV